MPGMSGTLEMAGLREFLPRVACAAVSQALFVQCLDAKRLHGAVQLTTKLQQTFAFVASAGDQTEIFIT